MVQSAHGAQQKHVQQQPSAAHRQHHGDRGGGPDAAAELVDGIGGVVHPHPPQQGAGFNRVPGDQPGVLAGARRRQRRADLRWWCQAWLVRREDPPGWLRRVVDHMGHHQPLRVADAQLPYIRKIGRTHQQVINRVKAAQYQRPGTANGQVACQRRSLTLHAGSGDGGLLLQYKGRVRNDSQQQG